jgi:hypothetical protein
MKHSRLLDLGVLLFSYASIRICKNHLLLFNIFCDIHTTIKFSGCDKSDILITFVLNSELWLLHRFQAFSSGS